VTLCDHDASTLVCRNCGHVASRLPTYRECVWPGGPGTELKKLLAGWPFYLTSTPDCACNARAAEMDRREQEAHGWCGDNIDTIVGWLREQAQARGLPFLDAAGRMLVRRAIRNARKLR
jgi:hypothetical protein